MKRLALFFVLGTLSLSGCDEKEAEKTELGSAKSAAPVAASATPGAPAAESGKLSPEQTYAAFLAGVSAKKPLAELMELMTEEEGVKIKKQIEGAKDPKRMLGFFYRMHDPVAEGHDPTVVSREVKGEVATVTYKVKAPKTGDAFDKIVTLQLRDGRWRIESIEMKSAK